MMKKVFFSIVLLTTHAALFAEDVMTMNKPMMATAQKNPMIVVVDLQKVGQLSKKFAAVQKTVETAVNDKIKEIKKLEAEFNEKVQKFQKSANDMNASTQQRLQEDLAGMKGRLQAMEKNIESFVQEEMRKAEGQLVKEVQVICQRKGYDVVLPGAIYSKPEFDRTNEIIAEMDKEVKPEPKKMNLDMPSKTQKVE